MLDDGPGTPLLSGDVTAGLVRIGATVRRPRTGSSDAVARLLRHLEQVGFTGAPRFLGIDGRGRDALTFVEGEVAGRPWPGWLADEDRLRSVAELLRGFHDAVAAIGVPDWAAGIPSPRPTGVPPRIAGPADLVGHRDITPENVVFRAQRAAALIDFDLLGPTTRVEEVANLLLWWAPWMPPEDREPVLRDADPGRRARIAVEAYGLGEEERALLVPVSRNLAARSWHLMRWRAQHLGGGWARMWAAGVGDRIVRRGAWLEDRADGLAQAVGVTGRGAPGRPGARPAHGCAPPEAASPPPAAP